MTGPASTAAATSFKPRPVAGRRRLIVGVLVCAACLGVATQWDRLWAEFRLSQARRALAVRDAEGGLTLVKSALWADPEHAEAHFFAARAYRRLGDMNMVREHLEQAWKLGIPQDSIQREEWLAMAQSGQLREAMPHFAELLIDHRGDGREICEAFANGMFLACRFREALELIDIWQAEFPDDGQPYLFRGRYLSSLSDTKGATEAYREGLRREPQRFDLRILLAASLIDLHEFREAMVLLDELPEHQAHEPAAIAMRSECLLEQGEIDQSQELLERILVAHPRHVHGRVTLARLRFANGRIKEALDMLDPLAIERPYDIEIRYQHGLALQADGQRERAATEMEFVQAGRAALQEARRWRELVMKADVDHVALRYQIGMVLLQYDSPEAGAGWLRSALEFDPNHRDTHVALAEYYERTGMRDLAEKHRAQSLAAGAPPS